MKLGKSEVAQLLHLPVRTIERWVRQGAIPCRREGGKYVFDKATITAWARTKKLEREPQASPPEVIGTSEEHCLVDCIRSEQIVHDLQGTDVEGVLTSAVERLPLGDKAKKDVLTAILERESLASTGLGNGVAIPHPRSPLTKHIKSPIILVGFLAEPIDFKAVDGAPVFIVFVLLSPDLKTHLKILSKLAFCLKDSRFIDFLRGTPDAESLLEEVGRYEAKRVQK